MGRWCPGMGKQESSQGGLEQEAGGGGSSPVSGADESGVPRLQLRGSGAGGGQCTSTDLEFSTGVGTPDPGLQ